MYGFPRRSNARRIAGGGWIVPSEPAPQLGRSPFPTARPASPLRAVLADPDPVARGRLIRLLEEGTDIRLMGESDSGGGALELIRQEAPDVLLLDVILPDMNGIELARSLNGQLGGGLIFVTEREDYALQAFEVHALDYLLKPVQRDRLQVALGRARALLRGRRDSGGQERLIALLDRRDAERQRRARLLIRRPEGAFFLKTGSIDWVEAAGKLIRVHACKRIYEQREALVRGTTQRVAASAVLPGWRTARNAGRPSEGPRKEGGSAIREGPASRRHATRIVAYTHSLRRTHCEERNHRERRDALRCENIGGAGVTTQQFCRDAPVWWNEQRASGSERRIFSREKSNL